MNQIQSFFWGIIAALGALAIELVFFIGASFYMNPSASFSFSQFFLVPGFIIIAAIIEEVFKCIIIFKLAETPRFQKSYLTNSLLVGLGFFAAELALISTATTLPAFQFLAEIALVHMGIAGVVGYMATHGEKTKKMTAFLLAATVAVIFHASYNLLNIRRNPLENYAVFTILGLLVLINIVNFFRQSRRIG